jgi:large subunit ribosomal protein L15
MPLHRRLPKRGFTNIFRKHYSIINIRDLDRFEPNTVLDAAALKESGLITKLRDGIKLLGEGEISHPVIVKVHKASRSAKEKIETAGGKVVVG